MRVAVATLEGNAPYSQSKFIAEPKKNKEGPRDYEERTWRERCHADKEGNLFIPPMAFKNCISEAARYLGEKIPGKGNATYSKHFEAGIIVFSPLPLPVHKDKVPGEWLFVPSDGKKGGGKRVMKCFPVIQEWKGDVEFNILDSTITEEMFERYLTEAGNFIGIGRFRPIRGGFYGRFMVKKVKWREQ